MILFWEINTISTYSNINGLILRLSPSKASKKIQISENHLHHSNQCPREAVVIRIGTELPEEPFTLITGGFSRRDIATPSSVPPVAALRRLATIVVWGALPAAKAAGY